jgi:hypothetical protein
VIELFVAACDGDASTETASAATSPNAPSDFVNFLTKALPLFSHFRGVLRC